MHDNVVGRDRGKPKTRANHPFSVAQNYTSTLPNSPLLGWDEGKIEDRMRAVYTYGMASHL